MPAGDAWLKDMVCRGAETSNRHYERLIAHYDINRGASDPPTGLDDTAREIVADLLVYAAVGFALILERAFAESRISPPDVSITVESFIATLQIPSKWVEKRLTAAADRAAVRAIYDELKTTGRVEASLPEDDRVVRDLYELEVAGPRADRQAAARAQRIAPRRLKRSPSRPSRALRRARANRWSSERRRPASRASKERACDFTWQHLTISRGHPRSGRAPPPGFPISASSRWAIF